MPSHFRALVSWRESPGSVRDLLDLQAVMILLTTVWVHQDAVDVSGMKLTRVVVMVATVVAMTMVIHVRMQQRVASITCFGRLMDRIGDEAQAWRAHQDYLKNPVADVRDRECLVITSLVAAGLHGVTNEHDLLVLIHLLPHYANY